MPRGTKSQPVQMLMWWLVTWLWLCVCQWFARFSHIFNHCGDNICFILIDIFQSCMLYICISTAILFYSLAMKSCYVIYLFIFLFAQSNRSITDPITISNSKGHKIITQSSRNKANLMDLIAATGLVILPTLDSNRSFFSPCDLEIWWMTLKSSRAPLLCYFKLYASFYSH